MPLTDRQISKLLKDISDLKKLALRQATEIKALKALIINKRKPLPTGAYVHIEHSYEWGCPTIRISPKNWKRIKSGAGIISLLNFSGKSHISPKLGVLGYLLLNNKDGNLDISENHSNKKPKSLQATEAASIPVQMLPTFMVFISINYSYQHIK